LYPLAVRSVAAVSPYLWAA